MNEQVSYQSESKIRVITLCCSLIGPLAAFLYETGRIDMFTEQYLLNLWVVVSLAIVGLSIGVYAIARGVLGFGITNLILNTSVAALYGFLAVFFSLGYSR